MPLPVTRYYGSKRKLVERIWNALQEQHVRFDSMLDMFGGSGIVSYYMAAHGKRVIYNDIMRFNCYVAETLLCTPRGTFTENDALNLLNVQNGVNYQHYIRDYYEGIYYNDDENQVIDTVVQNIHRLPERQKASAYYVLFQSCLIKRPFNLFHRKNLNLRTNFTTANFGNKKTWETSFEELFARFARELNQCQFEVLPDVEISNLSALNSDAVADLLYVDPPYFPRKNSNVTYHSRYHFLEGLVNYDQIPVLINNDKLNRELICGMNPEFEDKQHFVADLNQLFAQHEDSTIALSYNTDGFPSVEELVDIVEHHKQHVHVSYLGDYGYALNRHNAGRQEVLIIGQ